MKQKAQPKSVQRINCPKCGELQTKIYPYSAYQIQGQVTLCTKCQSSLKSRVTQ